MIQIHLLLEGIDGETADDSYRGGIDVLKYKWGAVNRNNSTAPHAARGGVPAYVNELSLNKYVDSSSSDLLRTLVLSEHIPRGTLVVRRGKNRSGDSHDYLTFKMNNIMVSSIDMEVSDGELVLTEAIILNFSEFEFQYYKLDEDGSAQPTTSFRFDMAENSEVLK